MSFFVDKFLGRGRAVNWIWRSACLSESWREAVIVEEKSSIKRGEGVGFAPRQCVSASGTIRLESKRVRLIDRLFLADYWRIPLPAATGSENNSRQTWFTPSNRSNFFPPANRFRRKCRCTTLDTFQLFFQLSASLKFRSRQLKMIGVAGKRRIASQ